MSETMMADDSGGRKGEADGSERLEPRAQQPQQQQERTGVTTAGTVVLVVNTRLSL